MRAFGFDGLSVAVAHKVAALDAVEEFDSVAHGIEAISIFVCRFESTLFGCNAD